MGIENDVILRRQELQMKDNENNSKLQELALQNARSFHKNIYESIVYQLAKTNKECAEFVITYDSDEMYNPLVNRYTHNLFSEKTTQIRKRVGFWREQHTFEDILIQPRDRKAWNIFFDEFNKLNKQAGIFVDWYINIGLDRKEHIKSDFTQLSFSYDIKYYRSIRYQIVCQYHK